MTHTTQLLTSLTYELELNARLQLEVRLKIILIRAKMKYEKTTIYR